MCRIPLSGLRLTTSPFHAGTSPLHNTPLSHRDFTVAQYAPFTQGPRRYTRRPFHTGTSSLYNTPLSHRDFAVAQDAPFTQGLRRYTTRPFHTGTSPLYNTPRSHRDSLMTSSRLHIRCTSPYVPGQLARFVRPYTSSSDLYVVNTISSKTVTPLK